MGRREPELQAVFGEHDEGPVTAVVFSPDGKTLAIQGYNTDTDTSSVSTRLWDVASRRAKAVLQDLMGCLPSSLQQNAGDWPRC